MPFPFLLFKFTIILVYFADISHFCDFFLEVVVKTRLDLRDLTSGTQLSESDFRARLVRFSGKTLDRAMKQLCFHHVRPSLSMLFQHYNYLLEP